MTDQLKPCPFCGKPPKVFENCPDVVCDNLVCATTTQAVDAETWNTRAPDPDLVEARAIVEAYFNRGMNLVTDGIEWMALCERTDSFLARTESKK